MNTTMKAGTFFAGTALTAYSGKMFLETQFPPTIQREINAIKSTLGKDEHFVGLFGAGSDVFESGLDRSRFLYFVKDETSANVPQSYAKCDAERKKLLGSTPMIAVLVADKPLEASDLLSQNHHHEFFENSADNELHDPLMYRPITPWAQGAKNIRVKTLIPVTKENDATMKGYIARCNDSVRTMFE